MGRHVGTLSQFYRELSRRRVFRTVIAYIVVVWVLSQGAADLFPAFGLEDWTVRAFVLGGIALIPVVALLSWRFDITPQGVISDPFIALDANHPSTAFWLNHPVCDRLRRDKRIVAFLEQKGFPVMRP